MSMLKNGVTVKES